MLTFSAATKIYVTTKAFRVDVGHKIKSYLNSYLHLLIPSFSESLMQKH